MYNQKKNKIIQTIKAATKENKIIQTIKAAIKEYPLAIILVTLLVIGVPVFIWLIYLIGDFHIVILTNISAGEILTYYGSISGGIITFLALYITIRSENNRAEMDRINSAALQFRPYFILANIIVNNIPVNTKYDQIFLRFEKYPLIQKQNMEFNFDKSQNFLFVYLSLTNIGEGIALDIDYRDNGGDHRGIVRNVEGKIMPYASKGESCILSFMFSKEDIDICSGTPLIKEIKYKNICSNKFSYLQKVTFVFDKANNQYDITISCLSQQELMPDIKIFP